jgi:hypothetical protein
LFTPENSLSKTGIKSLLLKYLTRDDSIGDTITFVHANCPASWTMQFK